MMAPIRASDICRVAMLGGVLIGIRIGILGSGAVNLLRQHFQRGADGRLPNATTA